MTYVSPLINLEIPEVDAIYKLADTLKIKGNITLQDSTQIKYSIVVQDEEGNLLSTVIPEAKVFEFTAFEQDFVVDAQLLNSKIVITVKDLDNIIPYIYTYSMVNKGILGNGKIFSYPINKNDYVEIIGL